jgi:hypothetical protein
MNWQRKRQHDSDRNFEAVKTHTINLQSTHIHTLLAAVVPQLPYRLRRLLSAAYAAHGGAENMKLKDWRDLELELNRRLENEHQECQR